MSHDFPCFFFDTLSRDSLALGMLVLQCDKIAIGDVFLEGQVHKILKTLISMSDFTLFYTVLHCSILAICRKSTTPLSPIAFYFQKQESPFIQDVKNILPNSLGPLQNCCSVCCDAGNGALKNERINKFLFYFFQYFMNSAVKTL